MSQNQHKRGLYKAALFEPERAAPNTSVPMRHFFTTNGPLNLRARRSDRKKRAKSEVGSVGDVAAAAGAGRAPRREDVLLDLVELHLGPGKRDTNTLA
eukprot:6190084-Pleurochrysis_carterae.AAC.2